MRLLVSVCAVVMAALIAQLVTAAGLDEDLGRNEVRIYSGRFHIDAGRTVLDLDLPARLQRLGYTRRRGKRPQAPGEFFFGNEKFWIYRHEVQIGGKRHPARLIGLRLRRADGLILAAMDDLEQPLHHKHIWIEPELLAESFDPNRALSIAIDLRQLPEHVWQAVLAAEDARFFEHDGIDAKSLARALLRNAKAGKVVQGGSTITQQLVKMRDLSPKRSLGRKASEAVRALALEAEYDKTEILEAYLNAVYFGHVDGSHIYGVGTAALELPGRKLERRRAEELLRESQERYELAVRGANDGIWDWNLETDEVFFSPRWKEMLGYDEAEIGNRPDDWFNKVHPADLDNLRKDLSAHLQGRSTHFECEHRILHRSGSFRWVLSRGVAVPDPAGEGGLRIAGSLSDIHDRKTHEHRLEHDAMHDPLTQLPNSVLLLDRLSVALAQVRRRSDYRFAVLFFDLDRFKVVNDSLGHDVGDKLLIEMGQRLKICLRPGDTVARLGGDEFAILLENIADQMDIEDIIRRIEKEAVMPFYIEGQEIFTSQSIGIAAKTDRYESPEEVLRDADIAMYQAKSNGGAQHVFFDSIMHATIIAKNKLEGELRSAVDRNEDFVLHYQPIIKLKDLRLGGFEALIRWNHRTKGTVPPNEFIPLAEETGLIIPISKWVLRQSCRQLKIWHDMYPMSPPLKMSVNISSKMLLLDDFVDTVAAILEEEEIQPEFLVIEITENVILEHTNYAMETLTSLKNMGVNIHIDDFGTGYSSLSYLHNFPVNALKIDRSFISNISAESENLEIIKTIVSLAHNLNLDVIAEGLEKEHQLSIINDLDCAFGQGFLFSKARGADAVNFWIESNDIKTSDVEN